MNKDVRYTIIAEVDGEVVFESAYPDTYELEEELAKAEQAVSDYLDEELNEEEYAI